MDGGQQEVYRGYGLRVHNMHIPECPHMLCNLEAPETHRRPPIRHSPALPLLLGLRTLQLSGLRPGRPEPRHLSRRSFSFRDVGCRGTTAGDHTSESPSGPDILYRPVCRPPCRAGGTSSLHRAGVDYHLEHLHR